MKRKVLLSLAIIAAVSSITFAVTRAFFRDTETSTGNIFTVGTLDLAVDDSNGTNFEPFVIEGIGASGNIEGGKTWTVKNVGSLPGKLFFSVANISNLENGCNEPEAEIDTTCGTPGAGEGDLGNIVAARISIDSVEKFSANLLESQADTFGTQWNALAPVIIEPGSQTEVTMDWQAPRDSYGNEIQGDSLTFDVAFDLEQLTQ
jgi:spore coat-associated protein N